MNRKHDSMGVTVQGFNNVITFERQRAIYQPGEVVNGHICFEVVNGQMSLSQLEIRLIGTAECSWTETNPDRQTTVRKSSVSLFNVVYDCGAGKYIFLNSYIRTLILFFYIYK